MAAQDIEATLDDAEAPPQRRAGFAILVLFLLCAVCAPIFADLIAHDAPRPRNGVVSYARWGRLSAPVQLKGEWRMTWRSAPAPGATGPIQVPGLWQGQTLGGAPLPFDGAASYHLQIRDLKPGRYTLFVPRITGASRVAVNGRALSQRGVLGTDAASTEYLARPHEVLIEADGRPLDLQIDVSTFRFRSNGIEAPPVFGLAEPMADWIVLDWIRSLLLVSSLLLLACYGIVVFLFRRQDRASLYSALGCILLLPLVGLLSHDNLLIIATPGLGFEGMVMVQYLTTTLALTFALAYVHELFRKETPRLLYLVLQWINAARFVVYVVIGATGNMVLLSQLSQWSVTLRTITFVFILFVVIRAVIRRREGALVFLFGLGAFFVTVAYTDLVSNARLPQVLGLNLIPIGVLLLLFSQIVILAERWSLAINTAEQTNADLRRLLDVNISITSEMRLEALLTKIVRVTSKVIHADRTSLFLYDDKTGDLWSVVAEGVQEKQIRFPATIGLAGAVFTDGTALNLLDAYADPRFNPAVDSETGYRTSSVLAVPVTTREGRRVGVMQALNHQNGLAFGEDDVARMSAFAAQAAIAIENATLFSEVAAERNYNESILRSMSNGVVTLEAGAKLAKLNDAAVRILEFPNANNLAGADARAWLAANNPTLLAEIDSVSKSGYPKTLLDADVRTNLGNTISANVSIVPLVADGDDEAGLLILIDDITEGKRVQGAMRRFMSQEVVDQVLGHGDELLFGAACRASVLFADIRNFTSLAETLQPRATVDVLNEVFSELFEAVAASGGVLDKFLGDAIMAVYGAPLPSGRDPQNAVESAVAMVRLIDALNLRRVARGDQPLGLGIGVASGDVVAGTIGSPKRMDYTVVGDSVNLASRLQQVTKLYQVDIIVCEETAAAVEGRAPMRELDTIRVRGRQRPSKIFEVLADEAVSPALEPYRRGREAMEARRWREAVAAFEAAVAADPDDRPSALMLDRARILARQPPGAEWDGVWDSAEAA